MKTPNIKTPNIKTPNIKTPNIKPPKIIDRNSKEFNQMTKDELKTYYKKIATIANKRARSLEEKDVYRASNAYNWLERHVYDNKDTKIYVKDKKGRPKFNTNTSDMSYQELKKAAASASKFVEAKTSTVSGLRVAHMKAYKTFQKKYMDGSNYLSFSQFAEFWKSGLIQNYSKIFGSDQTVRLTQAMEAEDLTVEELEQILKDGGFDENTQEGEISLSDIEDLVYLGDDFNFDEL